MIKVVIHYTVLVNYKKIMGGRFYEKQFRKSD